MLQLHVAGAQGKYLHCHGEFDSGPALPGISSEPRSFSADQSLG